MIGSVWVDQGLFYQTIARFDGYHGVISLSSMSSERMPPLVTVVRVM